MATLAAERTKLRDTFGFKKVIEAEADDFLNEGHRELCARSEWTRAALELGPTVSGQAAYSFPDAPEVDRVLNVTLSGYPLDESSETEVDRIVTGALRLVSYGAYWLSFDDSSVESVSIYPPPSSASAGLSLIANCVVYPDTLVADDDPFVVPSRFVRAIRSYAIAEIINGTEDNPDLAATHEQRFETGCEQLRRLRTSRTGRGGVRMKIEGVTS